MKMENSPSLYGLIGYPVRHSLSPVMHNAAFKKLKLNAVYMLFEKPKEEFLEALTQLKLMKVAGFNVTVPYKEMVIPYLDELDDLARQIGAVNTVAYKRGRYIGYNTDAAGFIASLKNDLKFSPRGKNIVIIGAGGAARAIGFALAKEKASAIVFYDILKERSDKLAGDITKAFPDCRVSSVNSVISAAGASFQLSAANLVVNASTCGMKKGDPLPINPTLLPKGIVVYDIIYNPSPTQFIKKIRAQGIRGCNGLGMLLSQGALAFEIWTTQSPPVLTMRRALLRELHGKFH